MSVAKKEEVCSHRLVPQLGELTAGVPIKKRPVSFSDKSAASGLPFSMKPSSLDANVITKGRGIITSQAQDHDNRSLAALFMTNDNGVLFNESSEAPSCAESDSRVAPQNTSHRHKLAPDLQLAPNGKYNSPVVKEEEVDQGLSGFSSAQPPNNVQIASEINAYFDNSFVKLPILDLNVPLDPTDSLKGLPTMHENSNELYRRTTEYQKTQVPIAAAPISTMSSGIGRNIDSFLNLTNSYGLSHMCGAADVTLDLQLKPPARPELGINWKGLAPAPELSLSLFGKPMDEPNALSPPYALFNSEAAGNSKKVSEEAGTLGSDKTPVEKPVTLVPCNAYPWKTASSTVPGIDKMVCNSLVKKELKEPSQQNILKDIGKAHLPERQSVGPANNCAKPEKNDSVPHVSSKTVFDLNSGVFPCNIIQNQINIANDNAPIPAESLPDIVPTESMPAVPEVERFVKREEFTSNIPNTAIATVGHSTALMAGQSLPLVSSVDRSDVGLCKPSSKHFVPTFEASCSNIVKKTPANHTHAHAYTNQSPCDALPSSSNLRAETLVFKSRDQAIVDGVSQGSADMDCSDDDYNTVSRFPTDKPHCEPLGNGPITKDRINANNLFKELKKEHDSDVHQDCSSLKNKFSMECVDNDKSAKIRAGVVNHARELGHQIESSVNEKSEGKQLLTSDKNPAASDNDNSMHDIKTAAGSSSTDHQRSPNLQKCTPPTTKSTKETSKTSHCSLGKTISPEIKPDKFPNCNQAASCGEDQAKTTAVKMEHQTESEEVTKQSDLRPIDSVLREESELDGASSSQPQSESGKLKSECDKSKPDSCKTSSTQNETTGQLVGSHWRDLGHAYVNRNERWERFMESEREKIKGEYNGGRNASDMINQRMTDRPYGGRGAGSRGDPRNFHGPRMNNEFPDEPISGRRRSFEDDLEHLHRMPRRSPPPGCRMREMDIDGFHGRKIPDPRLLGRGHMEDLPDDMMEERFLMQRSHRHHAQGDRGFVHRERSHSPAQRRGAPVHFHRGRSPEDMHRSPPLMRADRRFMPHRHHTRCHGSPLDQMGHDEREDELVDRRKYRDRRGYLRSPVGGEEEEMLSYHAEDDMEFAEGGGPREHDARFRNRPRGEREDGYRHHRDPQGWRDGDPNDSRPKRRRY